MSELTTSLIILGALLLCAMLAHGMWQARKARPRRAEPAARGPRAWQEPVLKEASPNTQETGLPPSSREGAEPADARLVRFMPRLDPLLDAMVPIELDASLMGESLLTHLPSTRRAGSKPFLIEGFNPAAGGWEPLVAGSRYSELQAGAQLANRSGPLNEIEYSEFVQKIESFAQSVGGGANFPDMIEVVARARELDAFAGQHDAQLAIHLSARTTFWSVGYVRQNALRHGFSVSLVTGRLVLTSSDEEGAPPVLTLLFDSQAAMADDPNQAALRRVTLNFDVPQTDPQRRPFDLWRDKARALAVAMEAHVVDDRGQLLSDEAFAAIGKELDRLYLALDRRGVPAGSMAARRLFG